MNNLVERVVRSHTLSRYNEIEPTDPSLRTPELFSYFVFQYKLEDLFENCLEHHFLSILISIQSFEYIHQPKSFVWFFVQNSQLDVGTAHLKIAHGFD